MNGFGIMVFFTDTGKQLWIGDTTPEEFAEKFAAGHYAHLRLDRPAVRIEHGQSAGAKFVSEGFVPNPSPAATARALAAQEADRIARNAPKRIESKPGDTIVVGDRLFVIGDDGEPRPFTAGESPGPQRPAEPPKPTPVPRQRKPKPEPVAPPPVEEPAGTGAGDETPAA